MNPHAQKHPFTSAALEVLQAASPPDVVAVLDEAVLHRLVGSPQAMHDALVHVAEMSQRPYIAVQVAPAGNGGGNCVEVTTSLPGVVAIRDSKNPDGPVLIISRDEWSRFTASLRSRT